MVMVALLVTQKLINNPLAKAPQSRLNMLSIIALAALASVSAAAPTPVAVARASSDPPSGCTSLGKGPLGFDPSNINIYSATPPARYLGVWGNIDDTGAKVLQPGNTVPQDIELFGCKHTPAPNPGKGAVDAYQGYIASTITPGDCLTISEQGKFNAHIVSKPCDFSSGGIAADQHFQFQRDSFYSYFLVCIGLVLSVLATISLYLHHPPSPIAA